MSFVLVQLDNSAKPQLATNFRPLRLGGTNGIVANHVKSLGSIAESAWHLLESDVVAFGGGTTGTDAVFFRPAQDAQPDGSIEFYRLESLHGICTSDRTDLVCHFSSILAHPGDGTAWTLTPSLKGTLCESVSLSGGLSTGHWQWTDSPMSLGAAVVGTGCKGNCSHSETSTPHGESSTCCGGANCH